MGSGSSSWATSTGSNRGPPCSQNCVNSSGRLWFSESEERVETFDVIEQAGEVLNGDRGLRDPGHGQERHAVAICQAFPCSCLAACFAAPAHEVRFEDSPKLRVRNASQGPSGSVRP